MRPSNHFSIRAFRLPSAFIAVMAASNLARSRYRSREGPCRAAPDGNIFANQHQAVILGGERLQKRFVGQHRVGLAIAHGGDGFIRRGKFDQRRAAGGDMTGLDGADLRRDDATGQIGTVGRRQISGRIGRKYSWVKSMTSSRSGVIDMPAMMVS